MNLLSAASSSGRPVEAGVLVRLRGLLSDPSDLISPPGQPVEADVLARLGRLLGLRALGGPGSGNFGHAGRPGEVGGSSSEGSEKVADDAARQKELAAAQTNPQAHPQFALGLDNDISGEIGRYIAAYGQEFTPAPLLRRNGPQRRRQAQQRTRRAGSPC